MDKDMIVKHKFFIVDIEKEQKFIDSYREKGYELAYVNKSAFKYVFRKSSNPFIPRVRIDYRTFEREDDYQDYIAMTDSGNATSAKGRRVFFDFMPYINAKWNKPIPKIYYCPEKNVPGPSYILVNPGWQSDAINKVCYIPNMESGNLVNNSWRRVRTFRRLKNTSTFILLADRDKVISKSTATAWYFHWESNAAASLLGTSVHPGGTISVLRADGHADLIKFSLAEKTARLKTDYYKSIFYYNYESSKTAE